MYVYNLNKCKKSYNHKNVTQNHSSEIIFKWIKGGSRILFYFISYYFIWCILLKNIWKKRILEI